VFQGVNIIEFGKRFQANAACLQYLMDVKCMTDLNAASLVLQDIRKTSDGSIYIARIVAMKNQPQREHCFTKLNFHC